MQELLRHPVVVDSPPLRSVVLALSASLALHVLGFSAIQYSGAMVLGEPLVNDPSHVLQASLVPATLINANQAIALDKQDPNVGLSTEHWGFRLEAARARAPVKSVASQSQQRQRAKTITAHTQTGSEQGSGPIPQLPSGSTQVPAAPSTVPLAGAAPHEPTTPAAAMQAGQAVQPAESAAHNPPLTPLHNAPAQTAPSTTSSVAPSTVSASPPTPAGANTAASAAASGFAAHYQLPNQVVVRYEAHVSGLSGKSVLNWQKTVGPIGSQYEAQLSSSATILFKTFEHRYKSSGAINAMGLAPLAVEEKRTNGSTVATTIEPDKQRVIISSKEGFLPYDPLGKDLVSLMLQLSINTQTQPLWLKAGTAQDFTVYRPSGIKRWRFQSMGMDTIQLKNQGVQAVYIKRVAIGSEPDYEDQHHFWLLPSKYGFPVKMRLVDNKGRTTDIVMTDWQEQ